MTARMSRSAPSRVLLTGAATLVGAEVLRELLLRSEIKEIRLLLPLDESLRKRQLERLETYLWPMSGPITPLAGDLRLPRFGLSLAAWEELATSFDLGFHCAQLETAQPSLELARQANLRPVETWIQLLGRNSELRLHHLSTAWVGGTRHGLFTEFDVDCGQGFHDAGERTKCEAEVRLRESPVADRVTIYRPSHVLGRAATGDAFHHAGAYPLLATISAASILPGDARARLDLVPADYVAASMVNLACSGATGTFHLACGWDSSLTVRQCCAIAARGRGRVSGAHLLPRGLAGPLRLVGAATARGLASRGAAYSTARGLLTQGPVFDTYLADQALADLGISRPRPEDWLETAVRQAEVRRWQPPLPDELEIRAAAAALPTAAAEIALARDTPAFREKLFHQVGEVNVAYREIGEGDDVVVFFHGLSGAHAWDAVVERVAARRRVLIVETLGLGDTVGSPSADFGPSAQAARVRGLLSALQIPSAHIVGNDLGGVIAQFFAVRWPQCVKSLVLSDCDAHGAWPPAHVARPASLLRIPGGCALLRMPAVARSRFGFGRMVFDKSLLTRERLGRYLHTVAGDRERRLRFKWFVRSFDRVDLENLNQLLGQVEAPTMVVWGADNSGSSASWAKTLYDTIPGARRLELIPFAGISCHEERPELFAGLLNEFYDGLAGSSYQTSGTKALTSTAYSL